MKRILSFTLVIIQLLFFCACTKVEFSDSTISNRSPQFSKVFTDDDVLKVELLGYGKNTEMIDDLVLDIHYKGQLIDSTPYDTVILDILNSITGVESGMKVTVNLYALDAAGNYELKYTDWYMHLLFWMNSSNAEALQDYTSPEDPYEDYKYDDGYNSLSIKKVSDNRYAVSFSVYRLCTIEDCTGYIQDNALHIVTSDSHGFHLTGIIEEDNDGYFSLTITTSTWDYLPVGEIICFHP